MTLRNKHLDKSSDNIDEDEIELMEQAKQRIDKIEELKEDVEFELKLLKCYKI